MFFSCQRWLLQNGEQNLDEKTRFGKEDDARTKTWFLYKAFVCLISNHYFKLHIACCSTQQKIVEDVDGKKMYVFMNIAAACGIVELFSFYLQKVLSAVLY